MKGKIDSTAVNIDYVAKEYHLDGNSLYKAYKHKLSDFEEFKKEHSKEIAEESFVFPGNLGTSLGIDETGLFGGDLYTIILNKDKHNGKGSVVAFVKGTKSQKVVRVVNDVIPFEKRMAIHDITLDFAPNMDWAARQIAVNGMRIYDRFHLERLLFDAVQSLRVSYRWEALEEEESGRDTKMYSNGDTKRQLLARSRYLLFKVKNKWSSQQTKRAAILFKEFPRIKKAYELVMEFKEFFRLTAQAAKLQIELWIKRAANSGIREFITLSKTVNNHLGGIINYFYEKQTNALLENFNGKIKQLKREVRGTRDRAFFFFRLFKLFA